MSPTHACGRCGAEFSRPDELCEHSADCEAIPDCRRCEATFTDRDAWFAHVYRGGCPDSVSVPPQPRQDRLFVEGRHAGQRRRFV